MRRPRARQFVPPAVIRMATIGDSEAIAARRPLRRESVAGSVVPRMPSGRRLATVAAMKLSDWLHEYRTLPTEGFERSAADAGDDWEEQDLLAPSDRVRSTEPRWRERASRVGYGRLTHF